MHIRRADIPRVHDLQLQHLAAVAPAPQCRPVPPFSFNSVNSAEQRLTAPSQRCRQLVRIHAILLVSGASWLITPCSFTKLHPSTLTVHVVVYVKQRQRIANTSLKLKFVVADTVAPRPTACPSPPCPRTSGSCPTAHSRSRCTRMSTAWHR